MAVFATKEEEQEYYKHKREKELGIDSSKSQFYRIKAKFKKGMHERVFQCLICASSKEVAIELAKKHFDDFIQNGRQEFTYKITSTLREDILFFASEPVQTEK